MRPTRRRNTWGQNRARRIMGLALAAALPLFIAAPAPARAEAPANNAFADATAIAASPAQLSGSNADATAQAGEPRHAGLAPARSVWFTHTAERTGPLTISTCGSTFTTVLAVYTGDSLESLEPVASDDEFTCDGRGEVSFTAQAGTTYRIALDGYGGSWGDYELALDPTPANDLLEDRRYWYPTNVVRGNTTRAAREAGEPAHGGHEDGHSVWYAIANRWQPKETVDSCGSKFETVLAVYRAPWNADGFEDYVPVPATTQPCPDGELGTRITFERDLTRNEAYVVAVDGVDGASGIFELHGWPDGDDRAAPLDMWTWQGTATRAVDTHAASKEEGEPDHAGEPASHSVWFRLMPERDGPVAIDACDAAFATTLAVYVKEDGGELTEVTSSDDNPGCGAGGTRGAVRFDASTEQQYLIALDGRGDARGKATLRVSDNDTRATAVPFYGSVSGFTGGAGEGRRWYELPAGSRYALDTCGGGTNHAVALAVYRDAENEPVATEQSADGCVRLRAEAPAGRRTYVAVSGIDGARGAFQLHSITNDDRADAAHLYLGGAAYIRNVGATSEAEEPLHAGAGGGHTVWYRINNYTARSIEIDTCTWFPSDSFDTVLAVYTEQDGVLEAVAANDDGEGCDRGGSRLRMRLAVGVDYWIAVDGKTASDVGHAYLLISAAPSNDDLADAFQLWPDGGAMHVSINRAGGTEDGEPRHADAGDGRSVWVTVTPQRSAKVALDTCASGLDTVLAAYSAGPLGTTADLVPLASNDDTERCGHNGRGSRIAFDATAGTKYFIALDGARGQTGTTLLHSVLNDDRAHAVDLGSSPWSVSGWNGGAAAEPDEPLHADQAGGRSVWFKFTPTTSQLRTLETCWSSFDTLLAVYTLVDGELQPAAANDDASSCGHEGKGSRTQLRVQPGTTYYVAVDGKAGAYGDVYLSFPPASSNDDVATPRTLTPRTTPGASYSQHTMYDSAEVAEPAHAGSPAAHSVWYRVTTTITKQVTVQTCGSTFDTVLAVYTGDRIANLVPVTSNDDAHDSCGLGQRGSLVTFTALARQPYLIAVDGKDGAVGSLLIGAHAPPDHDDVALPLTLNASTAATSRTTVGGTTYYTSAQTGEPSRAGVPAERSVWYRFRAPRTGKTVLDTCGSNADTVLAVYAIAGDGMAGLRELDANDDSEICGPGATGSRVSFDAVNGTSYMIAVDTPDRALPLPDTAGARGGTFQLSVTLNDNRLDYKDLGSYPYYADAWTAGATREAGEPDHAGAGGAHSVWYRFSPTASNAWTVYTQCPGFDTALAVYTAAADGELQLVAANDDATGLCGTGASRVQFRANAGTQYFIAVDGKGPHAAGHTGVYFSQGPENDDLGRAYTYTAPVTTNGSTYHASAQAGEPAHADAAATRSVWYRYVPATSHQVRVNTCGSGDTTLAVYTGADVDRLTHVASSDDAPTSCGNGSKASAVSFAAQAGTSYAIAVDTRSENDSYFQLAIDSPANNDFADAITLSDPHPRVQGTNAGASPQTGDFTPSSVWYRWTAPRSGQVTVTTCESSFQTHVAVSTGSVLGQLKLLASGTYDWGDCAYAGSRVVFNAVAGTTYNVEVGTTWGQGTFSLAIDPPANDRFYRATTLTGSTATVRQDTRGAARESGEPQHAGDPGGASVWWRWTAPEDGAVTLDTCGSDFDTLLAVYRDRYNYNYGLSYIDAVRSNDDSAACGSGSAQSRVVFGVTGGVTYHIAVDGVGGATGNAVLNLAPGVAAPANDNLAAAVALTGYAPRATGSNLAATYETGEPRHANAGVGASAWYRWTAPQDGPVRLSTCGSSFDTVLGVYHATSGGTAPPYSALQPVGSNDDAPASASCKTGAAGSSLATFNAVAGRTYFVAVDVKGTFGSGGDLENLPGGSFTLAFNQPLNDAFAAATDLGSALGSTDGTLAGATLEPGEPSTGMTAGSVWYRWTAPQDGPVRVNTCDASGGFSGDTRLAAYTGDGLEALTQVALNDDASALCGGWSRRSALEFTAVQGTVYRFAVISAADQDPGTFTINVGAPANDAYADAVLLSGADATAEGTTVAASREAYEPDLGAQSRSSVWYRWVAVSTGPVTLDICTADYDSALGVGRGSTAQYFTYEATNDNASACGTGYLASRLTFTSVRDVEYRIAVGGRGASTGKFKLTLHAEEDVTPPDTYVQGPDKRVGVGGAAFQVSSTESGAKLECSIDEGEFKPCGTHVSVTGRAEGTHTFAARSTDLAGNVDPTPAVATFVVDLTAPDTVIDSGPPPSINTRTATITAHATEAGSRYQCALDGGSFTNCAATSHFEGLSDGPHTLRIRAIDEAGNIDDTPATRDVFVDFMPPDTGIQGGPTGATRLTDITFRLTSTEVGGSFECSLDGAAFSRCESDVRLTNLKEGSHTLLARAVDAAGNRDSSAAVRTFTVDLQPPDTTLVSGPTGTTTSSRATFEFSSSNADLAKFQCSLDGGTYVNCTSPHTVTGLTDGEHTFRVRAHDAADNFDETPALRSWTVVNTPPTATIEIVGTEGPEPLASSVVIGGADADGDPLTYTLDFGDGSAVRRGSLPAEPIAHSFTGVGVHLVRLEVSDGRRSAVKTARVEVFKAEPVKANAGDDLVVVAGEPVTFDGRASRPSVGLRYDWAFGDGGTSDRGVATHTFDQPGTYTARLTVSREGDSDTDSAVVTVLPREAEDGLVVTIRGQNGTVAGAQATVVGSDGSRTTALTDHAGRAALPGLRDGPVTVYAYAPGHRPGTETATVTNGGGAVSITLLSGEVGEASIESREMTREEVIAAGIDPDAAGNTYQFEAHLALGTSDMSVTGIVDSHGNLSGWGGGGGGGGGCACSGSSGGYYYNVTATSTGGHPQIVWLVMPGGASFSKQFFDVTMVVQNLAPADFRFRNGSATLRLPDGLSLAPTPSPQSRTIQVADIAGGSAGSARWIVRGDREGHYDLTADYAASLEPVGVPVTLSASTKTPLHVWGASAVKMIIDADHGAISGAPFRVKVGMQNVADVPVYNVAMAMKKEGKKNFIYQPRQILGRSVATLAPGQTLWAEDYILVPKVSGALNVQESFVREVAGESDANFEIRSHEAPIVKPLRVARRTGGVILHWSPVEGASGYEIFTTPNLDTDFPDSPVGNIRWLDPTTAFVRTGPDDDWRYYAVSAVRPGRPNVLEHAVEKLMSLDEGEDEYPRVEFEDVPNCPQKMVDLSLVMEDPHFPLEAFEVTIGDGEPQLRELTGEETEEARSIEVEISSGRSVVVKVRARNDEGIWGPTEELKLSFCNVVSMGDSFSSGEGEGPYLPGTDVKDENYDVEPPIVKNVCHRSEFAYPALVDAALLDTQIPDRFGDLMDYPSIAENHAAPRITGQPTADFGEGRFRFRACSGGIMADLREINKDNFNELPQLDYLDANTSVAMLGIGGNDAFFADILKQCLYDWLVPPIVGGVVMPLRFNSCKPDFAEKVEQQFADFQNPSSKFSLFGLYQDVMGKIAPNARLMVVGYPELFPSGAWEQATCAWPVPRGDIEWLRETTERMNTIIKRQALAAGAEFVDLAGVYEGHSLCALESWLVKDAKPPQIAHPRRIGHEKTAEAVKAVLQQQPQNHPTSTVRPFETVRQAFVISQHVTRWFVKVQWPGSDIETTLVSPSGREIGRSTVADDVKHELTPTSETYVLEDPEPGEWTIRSYGLDVDPDGEPFTLATSTDIDENVDPSAVFTMTPDDPRLVAPLEVSFDATKSFDIDGSIVSYEWDFGDGSPAASGAQVAHTYTRSGTYTPQLTVTDAEGATDSYTVVPIEVRVPELSIDDVSVTEGDAGARAATFTISSSNESAHPVSVDYSTADGSAVAPGDFAPGSGTIEFAPGETSKTVTVPVEGDALDEDDERFLVHLAEPVNALIGDGEGAATIVDDDTAGLSIGDVTVTEGDSGTIDATFTVRSSHVSDRTIAVDAATGDAAATAPGDYAARAARVSLPPGETERGFTVAVKGDLIDEIDERFGVELAGASNAEILDGDGTATITDDDLTKLSVGDVTVTEGDGEAAQAQFEVSLSNPNSRRVSISHATVDDSAREPADYTRTDGTLEVAAGETTGTITVPVRGDLLDELDERFGLVLSEPVNADVGDAAASATIVDDDEAELSVGDASVHEGDSGSKALRFTISSSHPSTRTITADLLTVDDSAVASADYRQSQTAITLAPGDTERAVEVTVDGDLVDELDERFFAELRNPRNALIADGRGIGTIVDDDETKLSIADLAVAEGRTGSADAKLRVSLSNPNDRRVTVDVATVDATAVAPADYATMVGTLSFAPGEMSGDVVVAVAGDAVNEPDERFLVRLSQAVNASIADDEGRVTIEDDDRDGTFACRATVLALGDSTRLVANPPNAPCQRDAHEQSSVRMESGSTVVAATDGEATTDHQPDDFALFPPAFGDFATAHTDATQVRIRSGNVTLNAVRTTSDVRVACTTGLDPEFEAGSSVFRLIVNGRSMGDSEMPSEMPVGGATLKINHSVVTDDEVIQRALWLDYPSGPDIVVGEARAGFRGGNPCTA